MIKIVLIDDHKVVLQGLKLSLESSSDDIEVIQSFTNPLDAVGFIRMKEVDIVITDLRVPTMSGIEIYKQVVKFKPDVRFIALTSVDDRNMMKECRTAGFYDYIMKNADLDVLSDSILRVYRGEKGFSKQRIQNDGFEGAEGMLLFERLSIGEKKIFSYLVAGLKPIDIAQKDGKSVDTILTQKKRIFEKLNLHSTSQLIHFAFKNKLEN